MKARRPWICAGLAAALLAACGQRGPLSLPEPEAPPPASSGEPEADADADADADDER